MKTIVKILAVAAVAAFCCTTACDRHQPYRPNNTSGTNNPGGNNPGGGSGNNPGGGTTIKAKLMSDWVIQYKGREDYLEQSGYVSKVERFHIEAPGATYYLIRTINPEVFQENYGTDVIKFFQDEQSYLEEDAQYFNKKVTDYLYNQSPQDLLFDLIRHGDWKGFIIGFDAKGKITGEYATCNFTVEEENPTPGFSKWLGTWRISGPDPNGHIVSYDIEISSSEANYAYFVDKWETGSSIDNQTGTNMDGEGDWFETFFERSNDAMYFTSQFCWSYEENGTTFNEYLFGNIYYNGRLVEKGEYIIPETGLDIAAATMIDINNSKAEVYGCNITAYMTDNDQTGYETQFTSMQYFADDGEQILKFNLNVPQFPLTMERLAGGGHVIARKSAAFQPGASKRALKQHTQLRDVQKDNHKTQRAVARKADGTVK